MSSSDEALLSPAIVEALRAAFGDAPVGPPRALGGGRSGAAVLAFDVAGAPYVLRRANPDRIDHASRTAREIACVRIASALGVAPRVVHVDEHAGIVIAERAESAPFGRSAWSRPDRIAHVASALRRLHEGPAFPSGPGLMTLLHGLEQLLRARTGRGLAEDLVAALTEASHATRRWAESAPCHGDLNPGNILELPDRACFVDWENACTSDPFLDLGQLGVFAFPALDARDALLAAYLRRPPSAEELARATVGRVMALGVYSAAFTMLDGSRESAADPLPMGELLALLASQRQHAPPGVIAVSLLEELRRERSGPGAAAYGAALALLA